MSISTIAGALLGVLLIFGAIGISTDNPVMFLSAESILIVFGGTMTAAFIGYEPRYVVQALKGVGTLFKKTKVDRKTLTVETGKIIRWGYLVKKHGILALEREIKSAKSQDAYMRYGVELVITGYSGDEVRQMLGNAAAGQYQRAMVEADILKNMAAAAPAFGMVGTLIGLIVMLSTLGGDASAMGQGLAVALMTTLYGVLLARWVFMPASSKLSQKQGILRFRNFLIGEGFAMLAETRSPRYIQDRMNSYLDPKIHYSIDKKGGADEAEEAA